MMVLQVSFPDCDLTCDSKECLPMRDEVAGSLFAKLVMVILYILRHSLTILLLFVCNCCILGNAVNELHILFLFIPKVYVVLYFF